MHWFRYELSTRSPFFFARTSSSMANPNAPSLRVDRLRCRVPGYGRGLRAGCRRHRHGAIQLLYDPFVAGSHVLKDAKAHDLHQPRKAALRRRLPEMCRLGGLDPHSRAKPDTTGGREWRPRRETGLWRAQPTTLAAGHHGVEINCWGESRFFLRWLYQAVIFRPLSPA
jgi:hypothetical protein